MPATRATRGNAAIGTGHAISAAYTKESFEAMIEAAVLSGNHAQARALRGIASVNKDPKEKTHTPGPQAVPSTTIIPASSAASSTAPTRKRPNKVVKPTNKASKANLSVKTKTDKGPKGDVSKTSAKETTNTTSTKVSFTKASGENSSDFGFNLSEYGLIMEIEHDSANREDTPRPAEIFGAAYDGGDPNDITELRKVVSVEDPITMAPSRPTPTVDEILLQLRRDHGEAIERFPRLPLAQGHRSTTFVYKGKGTWAVAKEDPPLTV